MLLAAGACTALGILKKCDIAGIRTEAAYEDTTSNRLKQIVGYKAVDDYVLPGHVVGMGTGSTCFYSIERVAEHLRNGDLSDITVVPCSELSRKQCIARGITCKTLDDVAKIDVTIDGADEVDLSLNLVKGGSGSLLRERMIEMASDRVIIVADQSKLTRSIGPGFPIAVEVSQYSVESTMRRIEALESLQGCRCIQRYGLATNNRADGSVAAVSDNANFIVDIYLERGIGDLARAAADLDALPGVVCHGLFLGLADVVLVANAATQDVAVVGAAALNGSAPYWKDWHDKKPLERATIDARQPGVGQKM